MMGLSYSRVRVAQKAFGDDDVLQENVIYHMVRGERKPERLIVSSSEGADFDKSRAALSHTIT